MWRSLQEHHQHPQEKQQRRPNAAQPAVSLEKVAKDTKSAAPQTKFEPGECAPPQDAARHANRFADGCRARHRKVEELVAAHRYEDALSLFSSRTFTVGQHSDLEAVYRAIYNSSLTHHDDDNNDGQFEKGMFCLLADTADSTTTMGASNDCYASTPTTTPLTKETDCTTAPPPFTLRRKLDFDTPLLSQQQQQQQTDTNNHENAHALANFLARSSTGPSATSSPSCYHQLWKLYSELCEYYKTAPISFHFHAHFLSLADSNGQNDAAIKSIAKTLGERAAVRGDVHALRILLSRCDSKDEMEVLNHLPLDMDPDHYMFLISPRSSNQKELLETWLEQRIHNIVASGGDLNIAFLTCQLGIQTFFLSDGDGTSLRALQERWRLATSSPTTTTSESFLKNQLKEERENSTMLERKVQTLMETCHALEKEKKQALDHDTSSNNASADNTKHIESHFNLSPVAEEDATTVMDGVAPLTTDSDKVTGASNDTGPVYATVEALENALRFQVEKRIQAETALSEFQKQRRSHDTANFYDRDNGTAAHPPPQDQRECPNESDPSSSLVIVLLETMKTKIASTNLSTDEATSGSSRNLFHMLVDYDELLTSFVSSESEELDGDDEQESMMERRDVIWFLKELQWRSANVREVYEKETLAVKLLMTELVDLLDKAFAAAVSIDNNNNNNLGTTEEQQHTTMKKDDSDTTVVSETLERKEIEIAILQGRIQELQDQQFELLRGSNGGILQKVDSDSNNTTTTVKKLRATIKTMQQKYETFESRHRTTVSKMQESISAREDEVSKLRDDANKKCTSMESMQQELTDCRSENSTLKQLILQNDARQSKQPIQERKDGLQKKLPCPQKDPQSQTTTTTAAWTEREVDRVRLHYLEGMVRELERALAQAKDASTTLDHRCKYGSISLFDSTLEDPVCEYHPTWDDKHFEPSKLQQDIVTLAESLERSEHKRIETIQGFEKERMIYAARWMDIQELVNQLGLTTTTTEWQPIQNVAWSSVKNGNQDSD